MLAKIHTINKQLITDLIEIRKIISMQYLFILYDSDFLNSIKASLLNKNRAICKELKNKKFFDMMYITILSLMN